MKVLVTQEPQIKYAWPDGVEEVRFCETESIPPEHRDAQACIIWGGKGNLQRMLDQLPNLRWIQTYTAGPDALLACDINPQIVITNGINFHDRTVAEHCLGMALYLIRNFAGITADQQERNWNLGRSGPRLLHDGKTVTTLADSRVLVWGFGAIGQQIARVFSACGAKVTGIARSEGTRAGFPVITPDQMTGYLSETDVLLMVLPDSPQTRNVLNEEILSSLPSRAVVVNVGRGSAVDERALISALKQGQIAGAAIDVASTEPLPPTSELWNAPNLFITPHCAGFRPDGAEKRVAHNLAAYQAGKLEEMIGVVRSPE
ncbi:phosphoglycerate dehydrogenase [Actinomycetaceae bacterium TAE3-ERU4]|nr:phosphoglycerate dehydrogenase [Actinomycetaceae bacterium TAE3-ERU4]